MATNGSCHVCAQRIARVVFGVWGLFAVLASLSGQRSPCTGTFTDPTGAAIVAATVTFVQEISQTFGLEGDRVEVKTDDRGEFAADLLRGSPYAVWAIGPADEHGQRWLTGLSLAGAGGKRLALRAARRAAPARVALQNVDAWKAHCPPALRVLVGGYYALGHDLPLRGDGAVAIGPVPDHAAVLALVDDKRAVRCYSKMVDDGSATAREPTVAFDPPHTIECEVTSDAGEPMADATIAAVVHRPQWWVPEPGPLPCTMRDPPTPIGRTDANGRASVQVPWSEEPENRNVHLVATTPGYGASVSGYSGTHRYCHFEPDGGDGPMRFRLEPNGDWQLRILGRDGEAACHLLLDAFLQYRFTNGVAVGRLPRPARVRDGAVRALAPANCKGGELYVRLAPSAVAAPPVVVLTAPIRGDTEVDLANLTRVELTVRTARGDAVPFAHMAFSQRRRGYPQRWMGRCVADESGRVQALVTPGATELFAAAWADGAFGAAGVEVQRDPLEVDVAIAPLPLAELRIVDAAGAPVPGARIVTDALPRVVARVGEDAGFEVHAAARCGVELALTARSDADGLLRVPLAAGKLAEVVIGGS
ncbi:MAG: carboxypeptidase regulatory-like domain-containing protein, partial [Planctomycetes bacterium]|nr:carboxypeptidase regulatory-like domain-containing protein [Planctomycetota bacterium]